MKSCSAEERALAEELDQAQRRLSVACEAEGLLPLYEEVREYFCGEDAYPNYSLQDWLQDAEFRHKVLKGTWEYYRVSLVMAYVVSGRLEASLGRIASAREMLVIAESLTHELKAPLPSIYFDARIEEQDPSRRGGYVKELNRKCRSILERLQVNHSLDTVDFKSLDEAVSYAIEMVIDEEQFGHALLVEDFKSSYPQIFRDWLRFNAEHARAFKKYTGFEWFE